MVSLIDANSTHLCGRHAAELATAKKKNQNTNEAELLAEEDYSSDEEMDEKTLKSKDQYAVHNSVRLPPS